MMLSCLMPVSLLHVKGKSIFPVPDFLISYLLSYCCTYMFRIKKISILNKNNRIKYKM